MGPAHLPLSLSSASAKAAPCTPFFFHVLPLHCSMCSSLSTSSRACVRATARLCPQATRAYAISCACYAYSHEQAHMHERAGAHALVCRSSWSTCLSLFLGLPSSLGCSPDVVANLIHLEFDGCQATCSGVSGLSRLGGSVGGFPFWGVRRMCYVGLCMRGACEGEIGAGALC